MSYYGSITEGDAYFNKKLYRELWFESDPDLKVRALHDATERIDCLNFIGSKTSSDQELQFPRDGQTEVPEAIKKATFEIAFQLLDGRDPEIEYDLLRRTSSNVGPSRTSNDTRLIPDHIVNGIPSKLAWSWLKPFIRDRSLIALKRS